MEDLTKSWSYLTLPDQEGSGLRLTIDEAAPELTLAAKCLTKRALNIEAIANTFNPLWRSKNRFKVTKEDYHIVLFTFDNEEMEKILSTEPWSFDKHLMILQRYEKDIDLCDMNFNMVNFWIQVHDIPVRFRTQKVAEKIYEAIGTMSRPEGNIEVEGDGFVRVRVMVDISKPLCPGRVISLESGRELWVSFKYECLPNLCYWCGCLTHTNRDCDLWIESEGTLQPKSQQYGPSIHALPFTQARKNVVVVPSFYSKKNSSAKTATSTSSRKPPIVVVRKEGPSPEILRTEKETEVHLNSTNITPDFQGTESLLSKIIPKDQLNPSNPLGSIPNCVERKSDELFEERLQEIDRNISKFDTNRESDVEKQWGKNKEDLVQQLVVNEKASPAKVYSRALSSPISTRGTEAVSLDLTHTSELNARR